MGKKLAAAAALAALFAVALPASAEPVKLRMGWVVPGLDAPLQILGKPGITVHEGTSYSLEAIHFVGTPPMITALAADQIELAPLAYSTLALAVQNGRMEDLRIIADIFQDGADGYYTNEFMVLKDGPIKTVEDLKGRIVTSNAAGSGIDIALRAMLKKHGLDPKRDYTVVEAAFPNMKAMLSEHKTDLITAVRPFSADPGLRSIATTLFTQRDAIGPSEFIILTAHSGFLEKNRAAVVDYLEDALRLLRWYSDPANHNEAVQLLANYTKQPPERFADWLFTKGGDVYRDPKGTPDLAALQANIDVQREVGFLKINIDAAKLADTSLAAEAAARLK